MGKGGAEKQDVNTGVEHLFDAHGLVAETLLVQQKSASSMTSILMSFSRKKGETSTNTAA